MTNLEYIKSCSKYDLAELLAAMMVNIVEPMTHRVISQDMIDNEVAALLDWLEEEIVQGDYIN